MAKLFYLFYGEEEFFIEERINALKKEVSDPSLNIEQIEGEESALGQVVSALQTPPMLFGEKLLIIKDIDLKLKVWDLLVNSIKLVPAGIKVVFWAAAVTKSSKLYKFIGEHGEVCEFKSFAPWEEEQVVGWITRRVASIGKEIDHPSAILLLDICGSGLHKLASEIEKLVTYIGDRPRIMKDDVLALASSGVMSAFELTDALADKDLARSLATFRVLSANKVELFPLLSMLATQYRTMLQVKSLPGAAGNPAQAAAALRANPYFVRQCMNRARKFNAEELKSDLNLLLETDLKLKSGEARDPAFELLIASLCRPQN